MKKVSGLFYLCLLFTMFACEKEVIVPEKEQPTTQLSVTGPVISSVSSTESTFGTYASYKGVDRDAQTTLTINGSGFGTSVGTVIFTGVTSYYVTSVVSWTNTQVKVKARSYYNGIGSQASTAAGLKVTLPSGLYATMTVSVVPTVNSRQYRQCTWWASLRRWDTGRSVQPRGQSYSAISGSVNAYYVPTAGDIWIWPSLPHQAFVESVSSVVSNVTSTYRDRTWTISISEYNSQYSEGYNSYSSVVKIREYFSGTRSIISGSFRSYVIASASSYYR